MIPISLPLVVGIIVSTFMTLGKKDLLRISLVPTFAVRPSTLKRMDTQSWQAHTDKMMFSSFGILERLKKDWGKFRGTVKKLLKWRLKHSIRKRRFMKSSNPRKEKPPKRNPSKSLMTKRKFMALRQQKLKATLERILLLSYILQCSLISKIWLWLQELAPIRSEYLMSNLAMYFRSFLICQNLSFAWPRLILPLILFLALLIQKWESLSL